MSSNAYYSVEHLLTWIDEPWRSSCQRLWRENAEVIGAAPGSMHNHQAWPGGYVDHIREIMNLAVVLHGTLVALRPLPFSLSDLLLVLFLHDLEKPWKYECLADGSWRHREDMRTKEQHQAFRVEMMTRYGIELTAEQANGVRYAEGEIGSYSPGQRHMLPLAAMAHMCDSWSARGWYAYPLGECDPWEGAVRSKP